MGAGFAGFPTQPIDAPVSTDVAVLGIPMGVTYPGRTSHSATAPKAIRQQSHRLGRFLTHYDFTFDRALNSRQPLLPDHRDREREILCRDPGLASGIGCR